MGLNVDFGKKVSKFEAAMHRKLLLKREFYKKMLVGKGFEFDKYRKYNLGDDASLIDWRASMRTADMLIKEFLEKEKLKIFMLVDVGDNMVFGSGEKIKNEYAAEVAVSLAHLIINSGDFFGYALFSDKIKRVRPISQGFKQFSAFSKDILDENVYGGASNLGDALKFLKGYLSKDISSLFIISDFLRLDDDSIKMLSNFSIKFETIGIMIRDPVDLNLPDLSREIVVESPRTGEQLIIRPSLIREEYERNALEQKKRVENVFRRTGSDLSEISTEKDFVDPLSSFLKSRIKSKRYVVKLR